MRGCVRFGFVLCMIGALAPPADAQPSLRAEPLVALEPLPPAEAGTAWLDALEAAGARVNDEAQHRVAQLHPFEASVSEVPFFADVPRVNGAVSVRGTATVERIGLAETRVTMVLAGPPGASEVWAWNRLSKRTRRAVAQVRLPPMVPSQVRATVAADLSHPLDCVANVAALDRAGTSEAVAMLIGASELMAPTCVADAIEVVARHGASLEEWAAWFRLAWQEASAVEQAALLETLSRTADRPADLELLLAGARARERDEVRKEETERAARDASPVRCADGSVDPTCRCGDLPGTCCVYHGGVDTCLPPPPTGR